MYDGIFFVNHALKVNQFSVYTEEERYQQTLETINSINKYCPNNKIFIFDSSPIFPKTEYVIDLIDKGVSFLYNGKDSNVYKYSSLGQRSIAECISFKIFIKWFKKHNYKARRIYKLSGRYRLNDNFVLDNDRYKDAFVFAKPIVSPVLDDKDDERIKIFVSSIVKKRKDKNYKIEIDNYKKNFGKYYLLRFWHMDYNLLDTFEKELKNILKDCLDYDYMDVEHAYYKNLNSYKTIELDKIGVCGNIAIKGTYIDE